MKQKHQDVKKHSKKQVSLNVISSIKEKNIPLIEKERKVSFLSSFLHSIKRKSKQTLKNILLSRSFHVFFTFLLGCTIIFFAIYGIYRYFNTSLRDDVVVSKSEIIGRVAKLTPLPKDPPYEVVRVEDPEILKKQNSFYENIKSGDYIIVYPNLAIIFDLRNNVIVGIKKSGE